MNMENSSSEQRGGVAPRSLFLLARNRSALLMVDIQQKLMPLIDDHQRLAWNALRLIQGAQVLQVATAATEQYPQGLGATIPQLRESLPPATAKRMFSCRECTSLWRAWREQQIEQVVLAGIETHVCIQQTALDLLALGFQVFVPVDAVGARAPLDHQVALRRMESQGVVATTVESVLFEWCETSDCAEFKEISRLIRHQFR